jgi:hypothetical protein
MIPAECKDFHLAFVLAFDVDDADWLGDYRSENSRAFSFFHRFHSLSLTDAFHCLFADYSAQLNTISPLTWYIHLVRLSIPTTQDGDHLFCVVSSGWQWWAENQPFIT